MAKMSARTNSQFLAASVTEFISVWAVGGDASLNLTTKGGFTTIGFNCTIGHPGAPHSLPSPPSSAPSFPPPPPRRPRHRGQAERDRNKQRAARHQAAKAAAAPAPPASTDSSCTSATDSVTDAGVVNSPNPPLVIAPVTSDSATASLNTTTDSVESPIFYCDICEFSTTTKRGVKTHKGHKHREELCEEVVNNSLNISEVENKREEDNAPPLANSTLQAEIEIDVEVTELNTDKDSSPEEETLKEDILMLKLDHEYWTWPRNKAPPPKVHHPQEGLGSSPNLYTDALGFDQISYVFKTGVCDVFEIT